MEVHIGETSGLPHGAVLSLRAGNTRRQAPVPLLEPLRFPSLPQNSRHFKVDVLQTLSSAKLDISAANPQEMYTVELPLQNGVGLAKIGLTVREEPQLCGKHGYELKQVDRSRRRGKACPPQDAQNAQAEGEMRDYASTHNIPNVVQEMLQHVLRERPCAPLTAMAEHLRRAAVETGEASAQLREAADASGLRIRRSMTCPPEAVARTPTNGAGHVEAIEEAKVAGRRALEEWLEQCEASRPSGAAEETPSAEALEDALGAALLSLGASLAPAEGEVRTPSAAEAPKAEVPCTPEPGEAEDEEIKVAGRLALEAWLQNEPPATSSATLPAPTVLKQDEDEDVQRLRLEAEHLLLQAEKLSLSKRLAALGGHT